MNLLALDRVTKTIGEKKLFQDITFGIDEGQKAALIGVNGCGKSTLLRLIIGLEKPDGGTISKNKALKIAYLVQNPVFDPDQTLLDFIFDEESPRLKLIKRYEAVSEKLEKSGGTKGQDELSKLITDMEEQKIWDFEGEVRSMIRFLGINDLELTMGSLSGGMLKKVYLAQALIGDSNLLVLDEPTNHLDMETVLWLEEYLKKTRKAMLMVTHDRYFLDNVCTTLLEIDRMGLNTYKGNYSYYLEKKSMNEALMEREDQKIESILRGELEWLKRGPKARGTKQKARIERIGDMVNRERYDGGETLDLSVSGRKLGNKILLAKDVSKSYEGREIISGFSYTFKKGERIGFIGQNGSGKTTLVKLLTGTLAPDNGELDTGIHTHFGVFNQMSESLKPGQTLIESIQSIAEVLKLGGGPVMSPSKMLERFLFPPSQHYTLVGQLSGGEKRRLELLTVLLKDPNFLVLDEPTNDLDLKTLSVLEDFLTGFEGCLILISHDRYFLDRTVDTLFLFDGKGQVSGFPGNCSDYLEYRKELQSQEQAKQKEASVQKNADKAVKNDKQASQKLSFKEKQELEKLPAKLEALEKEKAELEGHFSTGSFDPEKLAQWKKRFTELDVEINSLYQRWEDLMARE